MKSNFRISTQDHVVNTCKFNISGDKIITGNNNGYILIWDVISKRNLPLLMIRPHEKDILTINYLTDNKFISGGKDSLLKIIEISESEMIYYNYFGEHSDHISKSAIIDSNNFITYSIDKKIKIFDIRCQNNNLKIQKLPILNNEYINFDTNNEIFQHDNNLLLNFNNTKLNNIHSLEFHPLNKNLLLVSGSDPIIRLFDLRNINEKKFIGNNLSLKYNKDIEITSSSFNYDGTLIASSILGYGIEILKTTFMKSLEIENIKEKKKKNFNNLKKKKKLLKLLKKKNIFFIILILIYFLKIISV